MTDNFPGVTVFADQLRRAIPAQAVIDDPLQLALYGYDGTLYEAKPELVILPETAEQAAIAVKACHDAGIPVVPRGAATSLSGGPVPIRGGAVLAFTRMDRVLELDYANQRAVVQPGVVNLDFQKILAQDGYFYAPDPASQCVCTLGGNVGENSGGPHCLKYGVTANHVLGLEMILPDGRMLRTGGKSLDGAGYDLTGIIVGSEGTFGLVTEITCRVMRNPETVVTMLAIFDSLDGASQAVSDIIAAGIIPATLEMMDNAMIRAVEQSLHAGYPLDAEAVLIIELDGLSTSMSRQIKQVEHACRQGNAVRSFQVAEDEAQRALIWKGRKGAFGAVVNIAPSKICTDISVPRSELPKVLAQVMEISRKWEIPITNVFHAGDGNLHPLVLFDPRDEEQVKRAKAADQEITQLAMTWGGSLTGEHGIGCGKRRYMTLAFGPSELNLMWRIKEVFDPQGSCNPDKILPDKAEISTPESRPLPDSEQAVRDILILADRDGKRIVLRGAGTKSDDAADDVIIADMSRLNKIVAFNHENLTITVGCGVTLPEIDEAVASRRQMLALRPRAAGNATLGGIIATNDSGPHRLLYGGPRDLLTGIRAALPNGETVRFGGSCVKNVSGYAVEKLFVGSHGTLGAILEMTLRTLPRPEVFRTLALDMDSPLPAAPYFAELFRSGLRPAAVELLNPAAAHIVGGSVWCLLVALEGFAADVDETAHRLAAMADAHKLGRWEEPDADYFGLWSSVTDLQPPDAKAPMLKASCPLSATTALAADMSAVGGDLPLRASPGLGLIHCAVAGDAGDCQARAGSLAAKSAGAVTWLAPVPPGSSNLPNETAAEICRGLKNAFDPNGVLPVLY